jgi:anti-anti-sigma factor
MIGAGQPPIGPATRFRDRHGCRALSLTGELDIGVRDGIERDLREHIEAVASSVIIVDLSAVTFMDSAGLDPLLRTHAELAEQERVLALQSISAPVDRLFRHLARIRPYELVQQTLRSTLTPIDAGPEADDHDGQDPRGPGSGARDLQAEMQAHALLNEAIGLLMAVHDCDAEQARLLLELVSRHRGVAVADLAAGIVAAAEATEPHPPGVGHTATFSAGASHARQPRPSPRTAPGSPP